MSTKKEIRSNFRKVCLKRDNYSCVMCHRKANSPQEAEDIFDVHHISSRKIMPNGGYCLENGITLCEEDHLKAEQFHATGIAYEGFSIDDLYKAINSNIELATEASKLLK
jgi:hypothetical protein